MIKVTQNTFRPDNKIKQLNNLKFSFLNFGRFSHHEIGFINFATDDFLGINRKFQLVNNKEEVTLTNSSTAYSYVVNALQKIFNRSISFFPDETLIHKEVFKQIIHPKDIIILDELVNPNLKLEAKQLHENNIFIIKHNNLEKLDELVNSQHKTDNSIWYVAQSIYPVPGSTLPLNEINILLEKYSRLHCYLDDSYGLSWTGRGGKGLSIESFDYPEKFTVTASLTKGFGANAGAVAISKARELTSGISENETLNELQSILFAADLHDSDEIKFLQSQLRENINYYQSLIKGHLPCISDPYLPISFIAGGLPEICHEVCSEMVKEGFYVSPAIFPHASIKQPGIKVNISATHTKQHIKNMTTALKETYHVAFKHRNKTINNLL